MFGHLTLFSRMTTAQSKQRPSECKVYLGATVFSFLVYLMTLSASHNWFINELEKMWKETVLVLFDVPLWHWSGVTSITRERADWWVWNWGLLFMYLRKNFEQDKLKTTLDSWTSCISNSGILNLYKVLKLVQPRQQGYFRILVC